MATKERIRWEIEQKGSQETPPGEKNFTLLTKRQKKNLSDILGVQILGRNDAAGLWYLIPGKDSM